MKGCWGLRRARFVGDSFSDLVAVIGGVGHDDLGWQALDQGQGLWRIAHLAGGEMETDRTAQASDGQVDLGAQATSGTTNGLIFRPPFFSAPEACW